MNFDSISNSNTTGDVPDEWYRDESHVGYSLLGLKLEKQKSWATVEQPWSHFGPPEAGTRSGHLWAPAQYI